MFAFSGLVDGKADVAVSDHVADTPESQDRSFEESVTYARVTQSSKVITNRSMGHARHVIAELFEFGLDAREPVYIVSGSLHAGCYGAFDKYVRKFDKKKIAIHAWVTSAKASEVNNSFSKALRASDHSTLLDYPIATASKPTPHFVVTGRQAFRFETNHANAKAILCFNDESFAGVLQDFAEKLFKH